MNEMNVPSSEFELNLELKPARKPERKKKTGPGNIESSNYQIDNNSDILNNNSISIRSSTLAK